MDEKPRHRVMAHFSHPPRPGRPHSHGKESEKPGSQPVAHGQEREWPGIREA
jgi:hypothetical protein